MRVPLEQAIELLGLKANSTSDPRERPTGVTCGSEAARFPLSM